MARTGLLDAGGIAAGETAVAAMAWRFGGALRVTVIAKASFAFAEDAAMARTAAQPIFGEDVHHGRSPARSVRFTSDLVPYLHHGEALFTGSAHAPGGRAVEEMSVRLGVFDGARPLVDKTLNVRQRGGFQKLPLVYEQAFGGVGWSDNPLGVGALAGPQEPEPTVFDPAGDRRLAGFGPLGRAWPSRRRLLGPTVRKALDGAIVEIPEGFDWGYFQAAPADQRLGYLRGDEWIVMDGLHPTLARVCMRLPGARGLARVYGLSAFGVVEGQPLVLHADTLRIDGEEQRCTLTFRGVFPVASEEALAMVRAVAGVELPGAPIAWPEAGLPVGAAAPRRAEAPAQEAFGEGTITLDEDAFESVNGEAFAGTMVTDEDGPPRHRTLPFHAGVSPLASQSGAFHDVSDHPLGGTLAQSYEEQVRAADRSVVPFAERGAARRLPSAHPPSSPPPPAPPAAPAVVASAPVASAPVASAPSPSAPSPSALPVPAAAQWARAAPPVAPAPRVAPAPPALPAATPALKKGLYGRFAGKR